MSDQNEFVSRVVHGLRVRVGLTLLTGCVGIMAWTALAAAPLPATAPGEARSITPRDQVQAVGQCQQRAGPFVTQSTAWQRLNQARSQGYGVSGVFPCYSGGSRGYCFNVFYPC